MKTTYFLFISVLLASMLIMSDAQKPKWCSQGCGDLIKKTTDPLDVKIQGLQSIIESLSKTVTQLKDKLTARCVFDFENGISDWEKTGTVFDNQPTFGDNPTARNRGQPARQQGDWWIGGFENRPSQGAQAGRIQGDGPQGTLTSPRFKIVGADMTFLIGGGCVRDTVRVELIIDGQVVKTATGECNETMKRRSWDVGAYIGKEARVKLVDFSSLGWGHINFDDLQGDIICV